MQDRVVSDLAQLPRVADGWTFLYTDKVRVEREDYAIVLCDKQGRVSVPVAALSALLLGPGATITHAAVLALAESGCSIVWCGEDSARFYAAGLGETRRANNLEAQARAWATPKLHAEVVRRLYTMRFEDDLPEGLSLEQIRGREGARVRDAYANMAKQTGVPWNGRAYRRDDWQSADPVNRALSAANACLYAVCHAAIVAIGMSPGLGFVHVGKQLSFVYDIADLYKVDVTVPAAFRAVSGGVNNIESRVRKDCRDRFRETRLLERIVPDLQAVVGLAPQKAKFVTHRGTEETVEEGMGEEPGALWNEDGSSSAGGKNFAGPVKTRAPTQPSVARTEPDRGDAYEDDVDWPLAASDDDEVPF